VANVFLGQSIGMRLRTIHFSSNFHSTFKTEESTVLGGFWALEWTWHPADTNLRCARSSGICMPIPNSLVLIVSEISAFIRTDRQTDMTRSTRLEILTKNLLSDESCIPFYSTSWGRKRYFLPVTYFLTNLVYPFTLRVTGMKSIYQKSSIPFYSTSNGYNI